MNDFTQASHGSVLNERQRIVSEIRQEDLLAQLLKPHAETYGLEIETDTWFEGTQICAVAFLQVWGTTTVTRIVRQTDGTLREWPCDSTGGPISSTIPFDEGELGKVIEDAVFRAPDPES